MDSAENHTEQDLMPMANHEKPEGEASPNNTDDDIQYTSSFKLVAIMLTINLSTMVAALDLVRS
jgi:hypothetical protein